MGVGLVLAGGSEVEEQIVGRRRCYCLPPAEANWICENTAAFSAQHRSLGYLHLLHIVHNPDLQNYQRFVL
jgi:hypothetical protein